MVSLQTQAPKAVPVEGLDTCDELTEERGELAEDLLTIPLHDGNSQHVHVDLNW